MHLNSLSPIESLFIDQIIVVNSSIKLEWLKEHSGWEADVKDTQEWMLQAVHHFFWQVTMDDVILGADDFIFLL